MWRGSLVPFCSTQSCLDFVSGTFKNVATGSALAALPLPSPETPKIAVVKGLDLLNLSFLIFPSCMVKVSVLAMVLAFYCLFSSHSSVPSFLFLIFTYKRV